MLKLYKRIHACKRYSTGTHTRKYIYGSTYVQPNTHLYTQIIHPFLTEYDTTYIQTYINRICTCINMDENWMSMYCVSIVNYKTNKFETRN